MDSASRPVQIGSLPHARYDLRILASLRRIIRSVDIYSRKLAQEHGVTVPQLLCMLKIDELGSLTVKDLAEEVHLNPSTIVGIVDRLEKIGVFCRERSVRDRRKVRILLTEKGKEMVAQSPSPLQDKLVTAIEDLPELERVTIALSLEKIVGLMEYEDTLVSDTEQAPVLETLHDLKDSQIIKPTSPEEKIS